MEKAVDGKQTNDLTIIIPAYNEEAAIGKTINLLTNGIGTYQFSIIVVNDGSSDQTKK